MADIKQCPYCAEDIKLAAIVCKHCGRELPEFSEKAPEILSSAKSDTFTQSEESSPIEKARQIQLDKLDEDLENSKSVATSNIEHAKRNKHKPENGAYLQARSEKPEKTHWMIGRQYGFAIAFLSLIFIGLGGLVEISEYSNNPAYFSSALNNLIFHTVTAIVLNFLITIIVVSTVVYIWRKNRSILYVIAGGVALIVFINVFSQPSSTGSDNSNQITTSQSQVENPPSNESASSFSIGCPGGCETHKPGCDIKGNIAQSSGTKIYHLPGQEYYDETNIWPSYGERWFCTEEEAIANGWRKANNSQQQSSNNISQSNQSLADLGCIRWDKVNNNHVGNQVCVYGIVQKIQVVDSYDYRARFSQEAGTFMLKGNTIRSFESGDCVVAIGSVWRETTFLFIDITFLDPGEELFASSDTTVCNS